jgi:uncharacterized damage-inducible protein DinB
VSLFTELFEYNAWANERVTAFCDGLHEEAFVAPREDLGGSLLDLLNHTVQVERVFLAMMTGGQPERPEPMGFSELRELWPNIAAGYRAALPSLESRRAERFFVPWFEREFTVEQGLVQVATHSVQHRAGIAAILSQAGHPAPNLDYIAWLAEAR